MDATHATPSPLHEIKDPMVHAAPSGEAFEQLLGEHEGDLRAFIAALVRNVSAREDVYQETARTLWLAFHQYDGGRSFGAWARGVARNVLRQHHKRTVREARIFSPDAEEAICAAWGQQAEENDNAARLDALAHCVKALPEDCREVIALFYTAGLRVAGIASRTGRTPDAVYQLLTRTRGRLAACIKRRLAGQSEPDVAL